MQDSEATGRIMSVIESLGLNYVEAAAALSMSASHIADEVFANKRFPIKSEIATAMAFQWQEVSDELDQISMDHNKETTNDQQ